MYRIEGSGGAHGMVALPSKINRPGGDCHRACDVKKVLALQIDD
jgi:hypothetical protein